jgi:hypothetical protein
MRTIIYMQPLYRRLPAPVLRQTTSAGKILPLLMFTSQQLHTLLHDSGFQPIQVKDETGKGIAFFNNLFNRITQKGLPALGLHLLMGDMALEKLSNLPKNLIEGNIVLETGIYEKVDRLTS